MVDRGAKWHLVTIILVRIIGPNSKEILYALETWLGVTFCFSENIIQYFLK